MTLQVRVIADQELDGGAFPSMRCLAVRLTEPRGWRNRGFSSLDARIYTNVSGTRELN